MCDVLCNVIYIGTGQWAQWEIELHDDVVKFKNVKTSKYLRIKNDGSVDVNGMGKGLTAFKYHVLAAPNEVRLEAKNNAGKFLALDPKNDTFISNDGKDRNSIFSTFRND